MHHFDIANVRKLCKIEHSLKEVRKQIGLTDKVEDSHSHSDSHSKSVSIDKSDQDDQMSFD